MILNEESTKIFRNVGEIHQSTWCDIEEDPNIPKHRNDKLKSHKYLEIFYHAWKGNLFKSVKKIMLMYQKITGLSLRSWELRFKMSTGFMNLLVLALHGEGRNHVT